MSPTPRDLRNAVLVAIVVTAVVTLALVDPSCRRRQDVPVGGPSRSIAPP